MERCEPHVPLGKLAVLHSRHGTNDLDSTALLDRLPDDRFVPAGRNIVQNDPPQVHREIELPHPVDGTLTNATYGNGVLVLSMPKAESGRATTPAEFVLEVTEATRGGRTGHTGAGASLRPDAGTPRT